jgi:hypothetical protein
MKIAVVGARQYPDREHVAKFVRFWPGDWELISGGATGVDTFAADAAAGQHRCYTIFYADWNRVGKAAGMLRNTQIVDACDALVAFVHGPSRGTMDSVRKAVAQGKPVWVLKIGDETPTPEEIETKVTASRPGEAS